MSTELCPEETRDIVEQLADLIVDFVKKNGVDSLIKRNRHRFPDDFIFRLNSAEKAEVVAKCDNLARLKFSPVLPIAFTEHGTIMAASVLNSKRAVETSVYVVRAFVRMREALAGHRDLSRRLDKMEKKYDAQFRVVFDAIRALMEPPKPARRRIGF